MREVQRLRVDYIAALHGRRHINNDKVEALARSIAKIGLRTPLTVRIVDNFIDTDGVQVDGQPVLVTGAHRLAAVKSLGWEHVECFVFTGDSEIDAKLWEIAENLHRAELTALERDEQVAEWIKLTDERDRLLVQVAPAALPDGRKAGPQHKPSGVRKAARELNIDRYAARRAVKVASLTPEAKEAAREVGLDDNRSALLRAAAVEPEKQADTLREIAEAKRAKQDEQEPPAPKTPQPEPEFTLSELVGLDDLKAAWEAAPQRSRDAFVKWAGL